MRIPFIITASMLTTVLAACQTYEPDGAAVTPAPATSSDLGRTDNDNVPLLVSGTCAGCHAVHPDAVSPIADAPTFVDIANRRGLTNESLSAYLSDAHNYPDQMDVDIDKADIKIIADYMLTLRTPDYKRPPS